MTSEPIPRIEFSLRHTGGVGFELVHIEDLIARLSPGPRRDMFYVIFFITGGEGDYFIDFRSHPIRPNTVFFITPGQVHHWDIRQRLTGFVLPFTEDFLVETAGDSELVGAMNRLCRPDWLPVRHLTQAQVDSLTGLIHEIDFEQTWRENGVSRAVAMGALLQLLLVRIQRIFGESDGESNADVMSAPLRLVRDYMQLVDREFWTMQQVKAYAERLGVTPSHLTDMAQQVMGFSAGEIIRHRVILEAKRLLIKTDQSAAEIAHRLNFSDASYFVRYFKREVGQTPQAFRKDFQQKYHHLPG